MVIFQKNDQAVKRNINEIQMKVEVNIWNMNSSWSPLIYENKYTNEILTKISPKKT